ncbi:MAG: dihydrofolate reductase [Flavobacteriaceae bacterium]
MPQRKKNHGLTLIAAASENNALGKDNELLWHLPNDFKRFKRLTMGHKIIMGRKTFESLPKPLPKRTHIIITRKRKYRVSHEDCHVVHSIRKALEMVKEDKTTYVIGGGEIYARFEKHADKIELTRVHASFGDADTFFPTIDKEKWELVFEEHHPADERHAHAFTFLTYVRK